MTDIYKTFGDYAAHAVLSIEGGEVLIPILCTISSEDKALMARLMMGDEDEVMSHAQTQLESNPEGNKANAFIFDTILTRDDEKIDSLIIDIREYEKDRKFVIAIPYRPGTSKEGFAFYRPKIVDLHNIEQADIPDIMNSYFDGFEGNKMASDSGLFNSFVNASI